MTVSICADYYSWILFIIRDIMSLICDCIFSCIDLAISVLEALLTVLFGFSESSLAMPGGSGIYSSSSFMFLKSYYGLSARVLSWKLELRLWFETVFSLFASSEVIFDGLRSSDVNLTFGLPGFIC